MIPSGVCRTLQQAQQARIIFPNQTPKRRLTNSFDEVENNCLEILVFHSLNMHVDSSMVIDQARQKPFLQIHPILSIIYLAFTIIVVISSFFATKSKPNLKDAQSSLLSQKANSIKDSPMRESVSSWFLTNTSDRGTFANHAQGKILSPSRLRLMQFHCYN